MAADSTRWKQRPIVPKSRVGNEHGHGHEEGTDPASAYLEQLGEGAQRTMREALTKLADGASDGRCGSHDLPWHLFRIDHTAALRTRLMPQLAPATANKHLAALRGVLKRCWRRGHVSTDVYHRAIDLPSVRGSSPREPNHLGAPELQKLAPVCSRDCSPAGARDEALLTLLYGANLRRSESVALDLAASPSKRSTSPARNVLLKGANPRDTEA